MAVISTLHPDFIRDPKKFKQILLRGAQRFRINSSYLLSNEVNELAELIHQQAAPLAIKTDVIVDLPGIKRRIGLLPSQWVSLKNENPVIFKCGLAESTEKRVIPIPEEDFLKHLEIGDRIALKDGKIKFLVKSFDLEKAEIQAHALQDCRIESFYGYSLVQKSLPANEFPERNFALMEKLNYNAINCIAISYASSAVLLRRIRKFLQERAVTPSIIAKIEELQGFKARLDLDAVADEIWFCRGDFGNNVPVMDLFKYEWQLLEDLSFFKHPVLIAGENLMGFLRDGIPSRGEVAHVAFLYQRGIDGIVLSDESTLADDPVAVYQFAYRLETKYRQYIHGGNRE